MIFPSVTEEEIAAIKHLSYDDRQSLIHEINHTDPQSIFTPNDHARDEIICPLCGNGTGKSHTGVKPTLKDNGWLYGCRKPNCQFNGLLTTIIGKELGLDKNNAEDLYQILAVGARFCNIPVSHDALEYASRRRSTQSQQHSDEPKPKKDYSLKFYPRARKNLPAFIKECGGTWRGFTLKELQVAGVGLADGEDGSRIIIPYDNFHCLARAVDADTKDPKKHYGSKENDVYNFDAVDTEHVIFVVEGEIDCLSIKAASGGKIHAVALGGVGEYKNLVNRLNQTYATAEVKPRFCVLADNDEGSAGNVGQETAPEIVAALMNAGYPATSHVLSEQKNFDANDWFIKDREELFARLKELEEISEGELEDAAQELQARAYRETAAANDIGEKDSSGFQFDEVPVPAELAFIRDAAQRNDFIKLRNQPESPARNAAMVEIIRNNLQWRKDLKGKKTSPKPTSANYRNIFTNDPVISGLFGYEEFSGQVVFLKQPPWKKRKCIREPWSDDADARLRIYLRENYSELASGQLTSDYFRTTAQDNSFHVVQDWIINLPDWDGTPRAEEIFIKFLNVNDTAYAREVSLNWLLGAVARIFHAGCRYDYCLILQGEQGTGKSYILEQLGGDWHIDLTDAVDSEKAVDAIQNAWLAEIGELSAVRRSDINALKVFLSQPYDNHRFAYERRATRRPRHCVFAGTINDQQPLNDQTGARRFNILECRNKRGQFVKGLDREYIQQVWAEVYHRFRQMFPTDEDFDANKLLLSPESAAIAARLAEGATADDGLAGEIAAFLDKPIPPPAIWRLLTKNERNKFIAEAHIVISRDTLKDRQRTRRRPKEMLELEKVLENYTQEELRERGESISVYNLYGDHYRNHISAAEVLNEFFNGTDRRKSPRRVNEVLSLLSSWEKGERIQNDREYGDQRNVYYRTTPLELPDDDNETPPTNDDTSNDNTSSDDTGNNDYETRSDTGDNGNGTNRDQQELEQYDEQHGDEEEEYWRTADLPF